MASITFSIPSSLAVQGSLALSGLVLTASGTRLFVTNDYVLVSSDLSGILNQIANSQTGVTPNQRVSGNFTMTNACGRYFWTGVATSTGILPAASTLSGFNFVIKNLTPSVNLFVSGNIDYGQNMVLPPYGAFSLNSDGTSWIQI